MPFICDFSLEQTADDGLDQEHDGTVGFAEKWRRMKMSMS